MIPEMTPSEFRAKRRKLGLSQEQLAHAMGITVRQMANIEKREEIPLRYQLALRWLEYDRADA